MSLTVYKRGRFWWVRGTVIESVNGKRRSHTIRESTRCDQKEDARKYAVEREAQIRRELLYGKKQEAAFGDAVALYVDGGGECRFLDSIIEAWGNRKLTDIKPGQIRDLAKRIYPSAGPSTWNRQVLTPVGAVINCGAEHGLASRITIKRFKVPKVIRKAVDRDWIDAFREHAVNVYVRALILFNFTTAARISEAVTLTPDHFDLEKKIAFIGRTKNDDPRPFFLTDEMVEDLHRLAPRRVKDGTFRVFGYYSRHCVYQPFRQTCQRAGIEYLGTHQPGRHSFATEAIVRNGVDIATAARIGNWKSHRLLSETYAHPENEAEKVEEIFGKSGDFGTKSVHRGSGIVAFTKKNKGLR